ncbi:unnamed protein product, partial [marine sediment metagenome]
NKTIANDLSETIGYTPIVRLNRITKDLDVEILGKLDYFNPSGSLKDRILFKMVEEAEKRGELKPGMSHILDMYIVLLQGHILFYTEHT